MSELPPPGIQLWKDGEFLLIRRRNFSISGQAVAGAFLLVFGGFWLIVTMLRLPGRENGLLEWLPLLPFAVFAVTAMTMAVYMIFGKVELRLGGGRLHRFSGVGGIGVSSELEVEKLLALESVSEIRRSKNVSYPVYLLVARLPGKRRKTLLTSTRPEQIEFCRAELLKHLPTPPAGQAAAKPLSFKPAHSGSRLPAAGIVFSFLLVIGLGSLLIVAIPVIRTRQAAKWPSVPCVIERVWISQHRSARGSLSYRLEAAYRYEVDGRHYRGTKYSPQTPRSAGYSGKAAVVRRLPPGSRTVCRVNPADPADSVLRAECNGGWLPPVLSLLCCGIAVWGLFRVRRKARRRKMPEKTPSAPSRHDPYSRVPDESRYR